MTTIEERLHVLECLSKELENRCREIADVALAELRDRDRIDRWHATRDAYVTGNLANPDCADDDEKILRLASKFADLTHGPLEIVVSGTKFDEAVVARGGEFIPASPGWAAWDAKVEALVKAARVVIQQSTAKLSTPFANALDALEKASKPFEEKET